MTWKNEKKSKALLVVFGIYLALLVWCILFKFALRPEEIPHLRGINLIPYAASVVVNLSDQEQDFDYDFDVAEVVIANTELKPIADQGKLQAWDAICVKVK